MKPIPDSLLVGLSYDPTVVGCVVGGVTTTVNTGYYQTRVGDTRRLAHRLVWALHYGDPARSQVDHINRDRRDNRIENLRLATASEQMCNRGLSSHNSSGTKGLHFSGARGLWVGSVMRDGVRFFKYSKHRKVVEQWLTTKRSELHKEFAHG